MADEAAAIEQVRKALSPLDNKMRSRVVQWASSWVLDHGGGLFGIVDRSDYATQLREAIHESEADQDGSDPKKFYLMGLRVAAGLYGLSEGKG